MLTGCCSCDPWLIGGAAKPIECAELDEEAS